MEKADGVSRPVSFRHYLRLVLTGVAMGAADIVPGVSGGTMAFVLGIYETLINAIKSFDLVALRLLAAGKFGRLIEHVSLRFLMAVGVGIGVSVVSLSGLLARVMGDPQGRILLFAFFLGLVIASIVAVGSKIVWNLTRWATLIVAAVIAFAIVNLVPAETSHDPVNLFLSGMVAICAMILPGISGSFILLILGQYDYVLNSVSNRDLPPVIFVGLGAIVGIIAFSRVLSWLLRHYYEATVAALVGFMIGSLWKIWPWKECVLSNQDRHGDMRCLQEANLLPEPVSAEFLIAVLLVLVGFLLVSIFDHLQSNRNPALRTIWRRGV